VLAMFCKGVLVGPLINEFKILLEKSIVNLETYWIVVRFCQICGIVISESSIKSLYQNKESFVFTRADIVDFVTTIKCLPILDYYTGIYFLNLAKKEDNIPSRITLTAISLSRLERVINFQFEQIGCVREKFSFLVVSCCFSILLCHEEILQ